MFFDRNRWWLRHIVGATAITIAVGRVGIASAEAASPLLDRESQETRPPTSTLIRSDRILEELDRRVRVRGIATTEASTPSVSFNNIRFRFASAELTAKARAQVRDIADAFMDERLRHEHFIIIGHTDAAGPAAFNAELSERRARAVRLSLERLGIATERIRVRGMGEAQLLPDVPDDDARQRRVEIQLVDPQ